MIKTKLVISLGIILVLFTSCMKQSSPTTGWDYNDPKNGGFQKGPYIEQETGPGLVLIEGGTFQMYLEQDSIISDVKMNVVVPSFYLDEKEVTNMAWCEYLYWLDRTFSPDFPLVYMNALPDTLCWTNVAGNTQNYINDYLRHPSYANYPVVGISWMQANNYCEWRTDRVNELILIREGILVTNPMQQNEPFTTGAYLAGQYDIGLNPSGQMPDLDPAKGGYSPVTGKFKSPNMATRIVRWSDGILLPHYRLPTEAEWEYASSSGVTINRKTHKKLDAGMKMFGQFVNPIYYDHGQYNSYTVMPVDAFLPNDFGVYNLAGNVSEWVADVYIERTDSSTYTYSPFVHKEIKVPLQTYTYNYANKLDEVIYDLDYIEYNIRQLEVETEKDSVTELLFNVTYQLISEGQDLNDVKAYSDAARKVRYLLDDYFREIERIYKNNLIQTRDAEAPLYILTSMKKIFATSIIDTPGNIQYEDVSPDSRIQLRNNGTWECPNYDEIIKNNDLRVYKGPNWLDTEKWVQPSFRRKMNKYDTSALVGFRCAMDRVGSPVGLSKKKKK